MIEINGRIGISGILNLFVCGFFFIVCNLIIFKVRNIR